MPAKSTKAVVGISYGLGEGPLIARRFVSALKQAGYTVTADLSKADIILGHSGGCYLIQASAAAKAIILIGIPTYRGIPLVRQLLRKAVDDATGRTISEAFLKALYKGWYLMVHPLRIIDMYRGQFKNNLPSSIALIIKNDNDGLSADHIVEMMAQAHRSEVTKLPGKHDDLWDNPTRYVELINHLI